MSDSRAVQSGRVEHGRSRRTRKTCRTTQDSRQRLNEVNRVWDELSQGPDECAQQASEPLQLYRFKVRSCRRPYLRDSIRLRMYGRISARKLRVSTRRLRDFESANQRLRRTTCQSCRHELSHSFRRLLRERLASRQRRSKGKVAIPVGRRTKLTTCTMIEAAIRKSSKMSSSAY